MFQCCFTDIDLQDIPYFDSLLLSNTFRRNFLLVNWLATFTFMSVLGLTSSCIFNSIGPVFSEIWSFGFCLVNSEWGTYLEVDQLTL